MLTYALAVDAFCASVTQTEAAALKQSKFRSFELTMGFYMAEDEPARASAAMTRKLLADGTIHAASMHLPFCPLPYREGGPEWDPAELDEPKRRDNIRQMIRFLRSHADMLAPMATYHASGEPPLSEHPQRISQTCRSLEELMPVAKELGFVINVEFLPRTCVGNCAEELQQILSHFDPDQVGICLDVNHCMRRYRELPQLIDTLAPRIRAFHLSDYDGIDENHWMPGQGVIDWPETMKHIRAIDHDVLLILETTRQLKRPSRQIDPLFAIRQNERAVWFLENCARLVPEIEAFRFPGCR